MELAAMIVPPLLTAAMNTLMPKMLRLVDARSSLPHNVQQDIKSLMRELEMMWSAVQEHNRSAQNKDFGLVQATWIKQVSELAHKIEDCVDHYIYDQSAHNTEVPNPDRFAAQIKTFKRESDEISILRKKYKLDTGATDSEISSAGESSSSKSWPPVLPFDLVGTEAPLKELLELVEGEDEDQIKKLKVISIHGFDGLGKTTLATKVYNQEDVAKQFGENRAWVNAAGKDPRQVLQEILQELHTQPRDTTNVDQLCKHLREFLHNKRYFIVIDDMRTYLWSTIKPAFPENDGYSSRVVVTTTIQPIAKGCCSTTGYVYRMPELDATFSEHLFFKSAHIEEPSQDMKIGSEELRRKCNGLPLALVSVAELLNLEKGGLTLTGNTCNEICSRLGYHLERAGKDTALARMQEVLMRSYNCLPEDISKACLVFIGMFPSGHRIRRKRLIRRWLAEGLFEKSRHPRHNTVDKAFETFKTLADCNLIHPIDVSNNDEVRSCQPPGMMLEFIRHRSMSESSTALFCDELRLKVPDYARRLSLHHHTAPEVQHGCDLSLVRSLTIFGKTCKDILNFDKYHLLRILDLEECEDLTNGHLKGICRLFLLNYLSLGGSVTELPKEIGRLKYLETLDVRKANSEVTIPVDLMMIPSLIRLFGKFKLLDNVSKRILEFFKLGKCNLEILAGLVVTDRSDGLLQLIAYMKNLRKVKIWCKSSTNSSSLTNLSSAIQRYIEDGKDPNIDRSLCIDSDISFNKMSQFSPEGDFYISSLKLHGDLLEIPQFVASLFTLSELCLSSPSTLQGSLLIVLSKLTYLVYLKFEAEELDNFVISDETKFQSLQRLCFVVRRSPVIKIEGNPLPKLVSFQLLYNNVENLPLINIERIGIKCLREVTICKENNEESKRNWKEAARRHPNRPRVFFIEKVCGPAEDIAVTEQPPPQRRNKYWKDLSSRFLKWITRNKERTGSSASAGNNGHPYSMLLTHEATGVLTAETSGSAAVPTDSRPTGESISDS